VGRGRIRGDDGGVRDGRTICSRITREIYVDKYLSRIVNQSLMFTTSNSVSTFGIFLKTLLPKRLCSYKGAG
jgi:hypothetical protein